MNRCSKTGLTDKHFRTILDVLNVYDPNDIVDHIPVMGSAEFMQDVQSAFRAVLAHVNRSKYGSDLGAFGGNSEQDADDLDEQDHAEADTQRYREDRAKELEQYTQEKTKQLDELTQNLQSSCYASCEDDRLKQLAHDQYIHGLS